MPTARPVWTSDEGTMAQETARSRWPKIVSGIIDDLEVEIDALRICLPQRAEGRAIVHHLHTLREEIKSDAALR